MNFDLDISELFGLHSVEEIFETAMRGGSTMTKIKYEEKLRQLEEKEGKLFTIPEISNILGVPQDVIRTKLQWNSARTFKLWHYKAKHEITLVPIDEVLKMVAQNTPVLPVLKALADSNVITNETTTKSIIAMLENYRG